MIAAVIFAVMSVTILSVYIQTSDISRKLQMTRYITESARDITERIASDVREKWIDSAWSYIVWDGRFPLSEYALGTEVLGINGGRKYIYGKKTVSGIDPCTPEDRKNPKMHCWLYLHEPSAIDYTKDENLVDSFILDDTKKRVKVSDLRFYISGDEFTEKKVTLVFTLSLMERSGLKRSLAEATSMTIQTTLSERSYRKY